MYGLFLKDQGKKLILAKASTVNYKAASFNMSKLDCQNFINVKLES